MAIKTTVGQLMVNEALPPDLQDYSRRLDKKGIKALFKELALRYPKKYKDIAAKLMSIGQEVAYNEGSSISLNDLKTAKIKKQLVDALQQEVDRITSDKSLTPKERDQKIVEATSKLVGVLDEAVYNEKKKENNRFVDFADSGARGGKSNVNQLIGAGLMVTNNLNQPIAIPITHNFSEGITPAELWAASYGVRKGYTDIKSATPRAGYFGKQLAQAAHKLVVTGDKPLAGTGLPVDTNDPENEGAVLARDYGGYKEGTIITPKVMKELRRKHKRILIHSPIASIATGRGIPRYAAGVREYGRLANSGDNVGISAAQALSEPLAQSSISSKHTAGVVGAAGGGSSAETQAGFDVVNRMANIPKQYENKATVSSVDGTIAKIEDAPQGGKFVFINNEKFFVPPTLEPMVKPGDRLEAGDVISTGLPSPAEIVKYKGIGEGRRYFTNTLHKVLNNSGVRTRRRNVELIARALINHIRVGDNGIKGSLPGDLIEYDEFAARYVPRKDSSLVKLNRSKNMYLEQPTLHYSVGTRMTPRVIKELKDMGISSVMAHKDEPDFEPEMQRAYDSLATDKDWQVRLGGFNLQRNMLESIHRSASSERHGMSFMPALAQGLEFGKHKTKPY